MRLHFAVDQASNIQERSWLADYTIEGLHDGCLIMSYTTGGVLAREDWIRRWISSVIFIEPAWLREQLVNEAKRLVSAYEEMLITKALYSGLSTYGRIEPCRGTSTKQYKPPSA